MLLASCDPDENAEIGFRAPYSLALQDLQAAAPGTASACEGRIGRNEALNAAFARFLRARGL